MKCVNCKLLSVTTAVLVAWTGETELPGQTPLISSLDRNGHLVATNLWPGSAATVEWAAEVTGPWSETWAALQNVVADSNGTIRVALATVYRIRVSNPDPTRLVWIPPGTFMMGSPVNEAERFPEEIAHAVTISRGFWMGRHEVTQEHYERIMGTNPSLYPGPGRPVETVSWFDATAYCAELSRRERLAGRLPEGYVYRLPTEAEWEYACRAGTRTAVHYGEALVSGAANFFGVEEYVSSVGRFGNPQGIEQTEPTPVGSYEPNAWGLHDMHGNVWEWCNDWYAEDSYAGGDTTDPSGPSSGTHRVVRGASWLDDGSFCRSAYRDFDTPGTESEGGDVGFRVVLTPVPIPVP